MRGKLAGETLSLSRFGTHIPMFLLLSLTPVSCRYFAGKVFGKDHEVQQGAARVRGESHTLPEEVKHPKTKQAEAEAQGKGAHGGI